MKAIVMAGGEGTRLRPLTCDCPKPMIRLIDRPVLEHIVELLKRNGITDICMTLGYLPEMIRGYFGDGSEFGVKISYSVEERPLGTAGGVRACRDFVGGGDFLVISGDCVCDFDLKSVVEQHRVRRAEATVVLTSHPEPTEYGLVLTSKSGRIERFVEKPSWDAVYTDMINTGIYVLSDSVMDMIPENLNCDFGRDVFPEMLRLGRALYGAAAEGYWCDMGSPEAYLKCTFDALSGAVKLGVGEEKIKSGVWSGTDLDGVEVVPPVVVGKNVAFGRGAVIGPCTVIGTGSVVLSGARVENSVIDSARIGEDAEVTGAAVCRNAGVGHSARVGEGAVIGPDTAVGRGAVIAPGVRIWDGREIYDGEYVGESVVTGHLRGMPHIFSGVLRGDFGTVVTPETAMALGTAAASCGRAGAAWSGGEAARVIASSFLCGVSAAGGCACELDSGFEAAASYAAEQFALPMSVFVRQSGSEVELRFFGSGGAPLAREDERKLISALGGGQRRAAAQNVGSISRILGTFEAYAAASVSSAAVPMRGIKPPEVAVVGKGASNRALREALRMLGCTVKERPRGTAQFAVSDGGMLLIAEDEEGRRLDPEQMTAITALTEIKYGCGRVEVPYSAPAVIDVIAASLGGEARRCARPQRIFCDGVFGAVRICSVMAAEDCALSALVCQLPPFKTTAREVEVKSGRAALMRAIMESSAETASELAGGIRITTDAGTVTVVPAAEKNAVRITGESENEELADKLCTKYERLTLELDER